MIPKNSDSIVLTQIEKPSKTYRLNSDTNKTVGYCDKLEAVKQAVFLILGIDRYVHEIYSWNYASEFAKLFGQPMDFVIPELERYIKEALLQDDRINAVTDFNFTQDKNKLIAKFTVVSSFGSFDYEKGVNL